MTSHLPKRIRLSRAKGWRKSEGAIVVSRPSKWGNPFRFRTTQALARVPALDGSPWEYEGRISADGNRHDYFHEDGHVTTHHIRYMTIEECIELYRRCLVDPTPQLHLWDFSTRVPLTVRDARRELADRDLACWCPLDGPCHADILLQIANVVAHP